MMQRRWLLFSFGIIAILSFAALIKKDDGLTAIGTYLNRLNSEYPAEKVHLHFDKPYYSIGDDMWFKAYVVNAEKNQLSPLSKVLYVEVIDGQDSVRKTLTLPITNGLSNGSINLADSLFDAGSYRIRAYTRWMQNFDGAYVFDKQVQIGDALHSSLTASSVFTVTPGKTEQVLTAQLSYRDLNNKNPILKPVSYTLLYNGKDLFTGKAQTDLNGQVKVVAPVKNTYPINQLVLNTTINPDNSQSINRNFSVGNTMADADIQFFAEGGNLVNGLRSKVAFKAIGTNGLGIDAEGCIEDQNHDKLVDLQTEHAGMGVFAFTPQQGNQYTAVVKFKNGKEKRVALPNAKASGYVLSLNNINDKELALRVSASAGLVQDKEMILMTQANNVIQYVTHIKMDNPTIATTITKNYFTGGMVHFTLFTPDYIPVAERLVFIEPRNKLNVDIQPDKPHYTRRQPVNLQIAVTDQLETPIVGAFSVAVTNQNKVNANEDNEATINSNLLLTSDLKGYIEKPNYYFSATNENRNLHLDLLMLTQGWSRFRWDDVKANKLPTVSYKPEQSLSVSGRIVSLGNKPIPFGKVNLVAPAALLAIDTVADKDGYFVFNGLDVDEGVKFVVKAKNAKDRDNARIILDNPVFSTSGDKPFYPIADNLNVDFVNYLNNQEKQFTEMQKYGLIHKGVVLNQVNIKSKKPPVIPNSIVGPNERADMTATPEQMAGHANLLDVFDGKLGLIIKTNKVFGIDPTNQAKPIGPMTILLDGFQIDDINSVPAASLAGAQVYRHGFEANYIGLLHNCPAGYGIIVLTTERRVTKYTNPPKPGMGMVGNRGYSPAREFYSPAYPVGTEVKMIDLRSTIYWNPNVITDNNGKAALTFYTADEPGTYLVTMEGLDTNGHLARRTFSFDVKN